MDEKDLSVIMQSGLSSGTLTDEEVMSIQSRMWTLLGKRTGLYTVGDSSSVPIETAEELLRSICFTIGLVIKSDADAPGTTDSTDTIDVIGTKENADASVMNAHSTIGNAHVGGIKAAGNVENVNAGFINAPGTMNILLGNDLEELLKKGQKKIQRLVEIGKWQLSKVKENPLPVYNMSYCETIHNIESFFQKYDVQFFAHEIPCSIDYQLCHAVPDELQGIKYINEYLRRIILENRFCRRFCSNNIIRLLKAFCPDYRELHINIYEPVAVNVLGIVLSYDNVTYSAVTGLDVTEDDRNCLLELFHQWDKRQLVEKLRLAAAKVCDVLHISNTPELEYLKITAENLYPRIIAALPTQCLNGIFISL